MPGTFYSVGHVRASLNEGLNNKEKTRLLKDLEDTKETIQDMAMYQIVDFFRTGDDKRPRDKSLNKIVEILTQSYDLIDDAIDEVKKLK